jgi:plastocyanin
MRRLLVPLIAVAVLASAAQSVAATTVTVQIGATGFKAKSVTINQGDTAGWTSSGGMP